MWGDIVKNFEWPLVRKVLYKRSPFTVYTLQTVIWAYIYRLASCHISHVLLSMSLIWRQKPCQWNMRALPSLICIYLLKQTQVQRRYHVYLCWSGPPIEIWFQRGPPPRSITLTLRARGPSPPWPPTPHHPVLNITYQQKADLHKSQDWLAIMSKVTFRERPLEPPSKTHPYFPSLYLNFFFPSLLHSFLVGTWGSETVKLCVKKQGRLGKLGSCNMGSMEDIEWKLYGRYLIHTHSNTYMHTYMQIYTYIHTYIHTYTHKNIRAGIHTKINIYIHTHTHKYTHTPTHTYKYTQTNAYIHAHNYTQKYIHTHTKTNTYMHTFKLNMHLSHNLHLYIHVVYMSL